MRGGWCCRWWWCFIGFCLYCYVFVLCSCLNLAVRFCFLFYVFVFVWNLLDNCVCDDCVCVFG